LNLTVNTSGGALNAMEFRVIGIFRTFSKEYDDRAVRIGAADAGDLGNSRAVHAVVVLLDDTASTDAVLSETRARLPDGEYEVKPWYELADFYNRRFALSAAVRCARACHPGARARRRGTINMVIYERTVLNALALGSRPRHIFALVVLENALLGAIGAVLGAAASRSQRS
jgi:putative ABC transport system permease protein